MLCVFDELGIELFAKRRETPPAWTLPLTLEAEHRESQSLHRLRRKRLEARHRAWAIRVGNRLPDPKKPKIDDSDYVNMIDEERARRSRKPVKAKPTRSEP